MALLLLVDDDQDILNFAKKILSSIGHTVVTALDAVQATELVNNYNFDMIISDANMPRHTGFDLVKALRKDKRFANIPIALLTARRERKDIEHAIQVGVDDYIVKPIDPALLVRKVETLFNKKPPVERASINLQEVDTEVKAYVKLPTKIIALSEVGIVLQTPQALFEGQALQVDSDLFEELGINPILRVLSSEPVKDLKMWRSHLIFMGADDAALQKIRAWINSETVRQRAAKAG